MSIEKNQRYPSHLEQLVGRDLHSPSPSLSAKQPNLPEDEEYFRQIIETANKPSFLSRLFKRKTTPPASPQKPCSHDEITRPLNPPEI